MNNDAQEKISQIGKHLRESLDNPTKHRRALKPDAQPFDEVRIVTVPRFKTSGLSGDEWRISANVQIIRKGVVVYEESMGNMNYAVACLPSIWYRAQDNGKGYFAGEDDFCDQEGCSEKATVIYKVKKDYCKDHPTQHPAEEYTDSNFPVRMFCERHSRRGDAAFDDADANYEVISGDVIEPREDDESPAAFGGVV